MARMVSAVFLVAVSGLLNPVFAGVTFIDPIPYLSAADSPFDMSGLGSTFFLEDFEDGDWDLPAGTVAGPYIIRGPSPLTDSVDGDDGVLDGLGVEGYSMKPNFHFQNFLGPPTHYTTFQVNFDHQLLGFVPNTFGFVWTDGVLGSQVGIVAYDEMNNVIGSHGYSVELDPLHAGSTSFDRFVGFYSDVPFQRVFVSNRYRDWIPMNHFEIDHVQFGMSQVPEPMGGLRFQTSFLLLCLATCLTVGRSFYMARKENHDGRQTSRQSRQGGGGCVNCLSSCLSSDSHLLLGYTD